MGGWLGVALGVAGGRVWYYRYYPQSSVPRLFFGWVQRSFLRREGKKIIIPRAIGRCVALWLCIESQDKKEESFVLFRTHKLQYVVL